MTSLSLAGKERSFFYPNSFHDTYVLASSYETRCIMERKRLRRIADAEWESHRAVIHQLYITEDKTLLAMSAIMATDHNFTAR
jgi:hypothetical protein